MLGAWSKAKAQPNMGENAISWEQGAKAWYQIRVNLCKKAGHRAQISSVGRKLLYEIHLCFKQASSVWY
jgi:hypothetical protein